MPIAFTRNYPHTQEEVKSKPPALFNRRCHQNICNPNIYDSVVTFWSYKFNAPAILYLSLTPPVVFPHSLFQALCSAFYSVFNDNFKLPFNGILVCYFYYFLWTLFPWKEHHGSGDEEKIFSINKSFTKAEKTRVDLNWFLLKFETALLVLPL